MTQSPGPSVPDGVFDATTAPPPPLVDPLDPAQQPGAPAGNPAGTGGEAPAEPGETAPTAPAAGLGAFEAQVTARLEAVERMHQELEGLQGEARVLDGHLRVRVNPAGALLDLHIDDRVMHLSGEELAGHVMAAVQQASAEVGQRLRGIVGGVVDPEELEAMMRGDVPPSERDAVRTELAARRGGA